MGSSEFASPFPTGATGRRCSVWGWPHPHIHPWRRAGLGEPSSSPAQLEVAHSYHPRSPRQASHTSRSLSDRLDFHSHCPENTDTTFSIPVRASYRQDSSSLRRSLGSAVPRCCDQDAKAGGGWLGVSREAKLDFEASLPASDLCSI